jgi:hypothetical protein
MNMMASIVAKDNPETVTMRCFQFEETKARNRTAVEINATG